MISESNGRWTVRTTTGRWLFLHTDGADVVVEYQPLVLRKGMQILLVDLDGRQIDSFEMTDAYPNPDSVALCMVTMDSHEEAVATVEWAARHLVAGFIGTQRLAEQLENGRRLLIGGLYETGDGSSVIGTVTGVFDDTIEFTTGGEVIELTLEEAELLVPVQRSGVTFLENLE